MSPDSFENVRQTHMPTWRGRILLYLVLPVLSICFGLLLAEVGLRVFYPQAVTGFSGRLFTRGKENLTYLKAGVKGTHLAREFMVQITANAHGYRDREWSTTADGDASKILFLGDSFLFGWGVERNEIFASRLRDFGQWQTYNAGMPDEDFSHYALRAAVLVEEIHPSVVVLCVYANDFTSLSRQPATSAHGTKPRSSSTLTSNPATPEEDSIVPAPIDEVDASGKKDAGTKRVDPILFRIKKAVQWTHIYRLAYRVLRENPRISRLVGRAYHNELTRHIFQKEFRLYAERPNLLDRAWPKARDYLDRILVICRKSDASLVVLQIPPSYVVDQPVMDRLLEITGVDEDELDFGTVSRQLRAYCRESELEFLDPTDRVREVSAGGTPMFYKYDLHFNAQCHEVMAEFLADWLADRCQ